MPPAWAMAAHYRSAGLRNGHSAAHPTSIPEAPQSVPVDKRVRPRAAPHNGINRALTSIVGGIITATGENFAAGGDNIERKVRDGGNGAPNPMQEAVCRSMRRRACLGNHAIAMSLVVDGDSGVVSIPGNTRMGGAGPRVF